VVREPQTLLQLGRLGTPPIQKLAQPLVGGELRRGDRLDPRDDHLHPVGFVGCVPELVVLCHPSPCERALVPLFHSDDHGLVDRSLRALVEARHLVLHPRQHPEEGTDVEHLAQAIHDRLAFRRVADVVAGQQRDASGELGGHRIADRHLHVVLPRHLSEHGLLEHGAPLEVERIPFLTVPRERRVVQIEEMVREDLIACFHAEALPDTAT
jgi:hypothetical protein